MVLLAFQNARASDEVKQRACEKRALDWLFAMQGKDGGWAAFDVDNNWDILSHVPFADHNAMLDPSCPDITGRVLEALMRCGCRPIIRPSAKACEYLLRSQDQDGSWYGRWGVNYIYGTFLALRGLRAAGLSENEPIAFNAALEFIRAYPESGRRMGRKLRELRRKPLRARTQHAFANRLGHSGAYWRAAICAARASTTGSITLCARRIPDGTLGRGLLHRYGLSEGLLSLLHGLSQYVSAACACCFPAHLRTRH